MTVWRENLNAIDRRDCQSFLDNRQIKKWAQTLAGTTNGGRYSLFKKGFAFHKDRLEDPSSKEAVESALRKISGKNINIECVIENPAPSQQISASKVAELFGGQVVI